MSQSLDARFDAFRQQRRMQAGSLIMTLFGDAVVPHGGRIWLGSLIQLLRPLGVSERLVRTAVYRLAQEGWLVAEARGRRSDYLLTPSGRRRFDEASRLIYAARAPEWDRRWRLVLVVGELSARERERLRRALFWQGFGVLGSDCFIHPGADLAAVSEALAGDGLSDLLGRLRLLVASEGLAGQPANDAELVRRAWNLQALAQSYAAFTASYRPILQELANHSNACSAEDAFLLRLLLIHDYRRLLLRDPELPEVLLPAAWPGQDARELTGRLYCRLAAASQVHLAECLKLADGSSPELTLSLAGRFSFR